MTRSILYICPRCGAGFTPESARGLRYRCIGPDCESAVLAEENELTRAQERIRDLEAQVQHLRQQLADERRTARDNIALAKWAANSAERALERGGDAPERHCAAEVVSARLKAELEGSAA